MPALSCASVPAVPPSLHVNIILCGRTVRAKLIRLLMTGNLACVVFLFIPFDQSSPWMDEDTLLCKCAVSTFVFCAPWLRFRGTKFVAVSLHGR